MKWDTGDRPLCPWPASRARENMSYNRKLILEDGSEFYGTGFGSGKEAVCEVVFNTSMAGYQEILSDPS